MSPKSLDRAAIQRFLPSHLVGEVGAITPVRLGLSGAGVYVVASTNGEYVLRVQGEKVDDSFWSQHLLVLRRAAERGVAPPVVHVDESAHAVLSARIAGVPLPTVLGDPARRDPAIADVVSRLQSLHEIDPTGIVERDPVEYARRLWEVQRQRAGFPSWAAETGSVFEELGALLQRDTRRVVSHNDVNPGNVLWDGARTWLVDWEMAGLGHPYYDLAAFVTFIGLDAERAYELLSIQEQSTPDAEERATFDAMRQIVALAVGYTCLSMLPDAMALPPTRNDAPTVADVRAAMRAGTLDLQTLRGQTMFGLAFLRIGLEASPSIGTQRQIS